MILCSNSNPPPNRAITTYFGLFPYKSVICVAASSDPYGSKYGATDEFYERFNVKRPAKSRSNFNAGSAVHHPTLLPAHQSCQARRSAAQVTAEPRSIAQRACFDLRPQARPQGSERRNVRCPRHGELDILGRSAATQSARPALLRWLIEWREAKISPG